jgi:hypothetical protein
MKTNQSPAQKTNRLTAVLALLAVFAVASTLTFGARRVLGARLDDKPTNADLKAARESAANAIPHLPDDTEDKLAAALYPTIAPLESISDPFSDRAGLGNPFPQVSTKPANFTSSVTAQPPQPLVPDRAARLSQWQQSLKSAVAAHIPLPPITGAYMVNEVAPTGKFEMNGRSGAWLYIDSEKRTIPANIGAKFYDGMLVGITADGVQFRTSAGQTRTVPWNRPDDAAAPLIPSTGDIARPPAQSKVISQDNGARTNTLQNGYEDLQQAVQNRYAPKPSAAPTTATDANATTQTKTTAPYFNPSPQPNENEDLKTEKTRPLYNHPYKPVTEFPDKNNVASDAPRDDSPQVIPLEIFGDPVATPSPSPSPSPAQAQAQTSPTPAPARKKSTCPNRLATNRQPSPVVRKRRPLLRNQGTRCATPHIAARAPVRRMNREDRFRFSRWSINSTAITAQTSSSTTTYRKRPFAST